MSVAVNNRNVMNQEHKSLDDLFLSSYVKKNSLTYAVKLI